MLIFGALPIQWRYPVAGVILVTLVCVGAFFDLGIHCRDLVAIRDLYSRFFGGADQPLVDLVQTPLLPKSATRECLAGFASDGYRRVRLVGGEIGPCAGFGAMGCRNDSDRRLLGAIGWVGY